MRQKQLFCVAYTTLCEKPELRSGLIKKLTFETRSELFRFNRFQNKVSKIGKYAYISS